MIIPSTIKHIGEFEEITEFMSHTDLVQYILQKKPRHIEIHWDKKTLWWFKEDHERP